VNVISCCSFIKDTILSMPLESLNSSFFQLLLLSYNNSLDLPSQMEKCGVLQHKFSHNFDKFQKDNIFLSFQRLFGKQFLEKLELSGGIICQNCKIRSLIVSLDKSAKICCCKCGSNSIKISSFVFVITNNLIVTNINDSLKQVAFISQKNKKYFWNHDEQSNDGGAIFVLLQKEKIKFSNRELRQTLSINEQNGSKLKQENENYIIPKVPTEVKVLISTLYKFIQFFLFLYILYIVHFRRCFRV